MFGLSDISIDFLTGHPAWVGVAAVILVALTVFLYFRTNPPLPLAIRLILGVLRLVAVLVLVAALLEPVLSFKREFEQNRQISVLVDHSSSMDRIENDKSRRVRVDSLLSSNNFAMLQERADVATYFFGENLDERLENVGRDKTALGDILRDLEGRELTRPADYWFVFSDGKSNSGRIPAEAASGLATPIVTVNMSSDNGDFDIGITEIDFNPIMFVGRSSEIKVRLTWHGAEGKSVDVQLREAGRVVASNLYQISEVGGFGEVFLKYVPSEPGQKLLQVYLPLQEGEATEANNSRTVSVKVLKSRVSVLLVSKHPDYEVGFLHRYLLQSDRYDVTLLATGEKSGNLRGRFPSRQAELNRFDLVILHDPDPRQLESRHSQIRSYLSEKGGGMWVIMGTNFSSSGPHLWLNELLPFSQGQRREARHFDFYGVPSEGQLFHPAVRLADDRSSIREAWAGLPPFRILAPCYQTSSNGVILAYASGPGISIDRLPILGYQRHGPGKLIASAALPFWEWGFTSLGYEDDDTKYSRFLDGVISWLTVQDDFDPIRIMPEREVFSRGEDVRFEGFAYDQGYRVIPDVTGVVNLVNDTTGESFESDLISRGEGKYTAQFDQLPPGKYSYTANFEKDGRLLKEKEGVIQVEFFSLEEYDQHGDAASLMALSRASGGQYFTHEQFTEAVNSLDLGRVAESESGEIVFWGKLWLLLLFIGTLAVEWFLRKAYDLV